MSSPATVDAIVIERRELKEIIREVLREELARFATFPNEDWEIEEGSVLWQDLVELKKEAREGRLRLYASKEDFRE